MIRCCIVAEGPQECNGLAEDYPTPTLSAGDNDTIRAKGGAAGAFRRASEKMWVY